MEYHVDLVPTPYFIRSSRPFGFVCPACRGEISYAEVMYGTDATAARADMFALVTGDSLYRPCPTCGATVHFMFQGPPAVLAMSMGGGPSVRAKARVFSRRLRDGVLRFLVPRTAVSGVSM